MTIVQIFTQWPDLLWLPLSLVAVERGKRLLTIGFVLSCVLLLRLQVELMDQIGFREGYLKLMDSDVLSRGLVTYGVFIAFFLLIAHFSRGSNKNIHMAASITILIAAFCVSTFVMVL